MTNEEARAILAGFEDVDIGTVVKAALGTGLRQGELLALRWQDIDFEAATVEVKATLQRLDGETRLLPPKTDQSYRTVPVAPFALGALKRQREDQTAMRLLREGGWTNEHDLVFTGEDGRPLHASAVRWAFQSKLAQAGLPRRRFHESRHGFATLLLAQGVEMRVIMEMLGHSEMQTTALVYTHVVPELQRSAAVKLENLLG